MKVAGIQCGRSPCGHQQQSSAIAAPAHLQRPSIALRSPAAPCAKSEGTAACTSDTRESTRGTCRRGSRGRGRRRACTPRAASSACRTVGTAGGPAARHWPPTTPRPFRSASASSRRPGRRGARRRVARREQATVGSRRWVAPRTRPHPRGSTAGCASRADTACAPGKVAPCTTGGSRSCRVAGCARCGAGRTPRQSGRARDAPRRSAARPQRPPHSCHPRLAASEAQKHEIGSVSQRNGGENER